MRLGPWDKQRSIYGEGRDSRLYYYGMDLLRDAWYVKSAIHEVSRLYKSRIEGMQVEIQQKKHRMEDLLAGCMEQRNS